MGSFPPFILYPAVIYMAFITADSNTRCCHKYGFQHHAGFCFQNSLIALQLCRISWNVLLPHTCMCHRVWPLYNLTVHKLQHQAIHFFSDFNHTTIWKCFLIILGKFVSLFKVWQQITVGKCCNEWSGNIFP